MSRQNKAQKYPVVFYTLLIVLPIIIGVVSLSVGRYNVPIKNVLNILAGQFTGDEANTSSITQNVILNLRLPRIIVALAVGSGLAVAGAAIQGMFANPLATPDTIGVSSGAAFGAVVGILLTDNLYIIQLLAFVMGISATFLTYWLSKLGKTKNLIMIVLAGMIVSSFFSAMISLVKTVADTDTKLPSIVYWLMGSMASTSYKSLMAGIPLMIIGIIFIFILRWKINLLLLSEEEAESMGIRVNRMRMILMGCCALITASSVSICGQVGWIGLLVPHLSRMIIGNNNKYVIPVSISLGAIFMLVVDTLARTVLPTEIPLSIITAIIGTPFFAYLMGKTGGTWR